MRTAIFLLVQQLSILVSLSVECSIAMRLYGERLDRLIATSWERLGEVCETTGPGDAQLARVTLKRKRTTTPRSKTPGAGREPCMQFFVEKSVRLIMCYIHDAYFSRSTSTRKTMLSLFGVVYEQSLMMWRIWSSTGDNWSKSSPGKRVHAVKGAFIASIAMQLGDDIAYDYIASRVERPSPRKMSEMIFGFCESIEFTFSKGCYNYALNTSPQFAFIELFGQSLFVHRLTDDIEKASVLIAETVAMILKVDTCLTGAGASADTDFFEVKRLNATIASAFMLPEWRLHHCAIVTPREGDERAHSSISPLTTRESRGADEDDCVERGCDKRHPALEYNPLGTTSNLVEPHHSEAPSTASSAVTKSPSISSDSTSVSSEEYIGACALCQLSCTPTRWGAVTRFNF